MKSTWIVLAESARARILSTSDAGKTFQEVSDLCHPESRQHNTELSSDLPGRTFDSHGDGRHGMEQSTTPKKREAREFAVEVARRVERGLSDGHFDSLILVAPPAFLGRLRTELGKSARTAIVGELDKNLVEADREVVADRISAMLRTPRAGA